MPYHVYILYSEKCRRHYIGYSEDVNARLERHKSGLVTATRNCKPYTLKAYKSFETELEARKEERRIKRAKNTNYLFWLIQGNW